MNKTLRLLISLGKKEEAVAAVMMRLSMLDDYEAPEGSLEKDVDLITQKVPDIFYRKLIKQEADSEGERKLFWMHLLARFCFSCKKYRESATWYRKLYMINKDPWMLLFEAQCWFALGDRKREMKLLQLASILEPDNKFFAELLNDRKIADE